MIEPLKTVDALDAHAAIAWDQAAKKIMAVCVSQSHGECVGVPRVGFGGQDLEEDSRQQFSAGRAHDAGHGGRRPQLEILLPLDAGSQNDVRHVEKAIAMHHAQAAGTVVARGDEEVIGFIAVTLHRRHPRLLKDELGARHVSAGGILEDAAQERSRFVGTPTRSQTRLTLELSVKRIRAEVLDHAVFDLLEIPERQQSNLATGKRLEHVR